ncbi:MAG: hypothetical protein QOH81_994 [Sphingomonadales bacterium]|jgi:hypothetical protein|nr:hypothetical protein [Sphingomonadales bacterium]
MTIGRSRIETAGGAAYRRAMPVKHLMRLLTILALLLAPLGMLTPAQAAGHHANSVAMALGHCPDAPRSHNQPAQAHDCLIACAALPSFGSEVEPELFVAAAVAPLPLERIRSEFVPEAAIPPPRAS